MDILNCDAYHPRVTNHFRSEVKSAANESMRRKTKILLAVFSVLSACDGGIEVDEAALLACAKPGHAFELGTGITGFESIQPGQEILFENGIQGGFHLWASIRIGEVDPIDTLLEFELHQDGSQVGGRTLPKTLYCGERGYEYVGVPVELFFHGSAHSVAGRPMEIRATLTERNGMTHTASTSFVPKCCTGQD
jgi:hypothetical protein